MAIKNQRTWIVFFALAGMSGLAYVAYSVNRGGGAAISGPATPSAEVAQAVIVEVAQVVIQEFTDEASAVGTLRSNESVVLRPEISGRIARIGFKDGEIVAKGAPLLALDGAVQEAELLQAEANLALAQATQKRNEDLFGRKFISLQALENSAATLKVQEASVALAHAKLAKTRIQAPFAGVVGIRKVSLGDYVKEGEDLVNLEDISTLKVDFRLPEAYLGRLQKNLGVEVSSDALAGNAFQAVLQAIDPLVDEGGRSIGCRALLPNTQNQLRPGMFVRVRIVFGEQKRALMIPEQAVVTGGKPMVFVVEEGKAKATPVHLGVRRAGRVEVLGGLQAGDTVVTAGQLKIKNGLPVRTMGGIGLPPGDAAGGTSGMAGTLPARGK